MDDWRSVALAKGVDQNNPEALRAAGINVGNSVGGGTDYGAQMRGAVQPAVDALNATASAIACVRIYPSRSLSGSPENRLTSRLDKIVMLCLRYF